LIFAVFKAKEEGGEDILQCTLFNGKFEEFEGHLASFSRQTRRIS
jgi:hypothetical protein